MKLKRFQKLAPLGVSIFALLSVAGCKGQDEENKPTEPSPQTGGPQLTEPPQEEKGPEEGPKNIANILESAEAVQGEGARDFPETVILNNALAAARESGRPLLVDATGAWCPPCQMFDTAKNNGDETMDAETFQEIYNQFDHLDFEETFTTLPWFWTYLPLEVPGIPTYMVFDPLADKWHAVQIGFGRLQEMADNLQRVLGAIQNGGDGQPDDEVETPYEELKAKWMSFLETGLAGTFDPENKGHFYNHIEYIERTAAERPFEETSALIDQISKLFNADPEFFLPYESLEGMGFFIAQWVEMAIKNERIELEGVQANFPNVFELIKTQALSIGFANPILKLAGSQGPNVAASICNELRDYVVEQFEVETVMAAEQATCYVIESFAGTVDQEAFGTFVSGLQTVNRWDEVTETNHIEVDRLVRIAPLTGNYELALTATEADHSRRVTRLEEIMAEYQPELDKLLEELENTENAEKRAELERQIEGWKAVLSNYEKIGREYVRVYETRIEAFSGNNRFGEPVSSPMQLHPLFR